MRYTILRTFSQDLIYRMFPNQWISESKIEYEKIRVIDIMFIEYNHE